jgi:cytochrome c553
MTRAFVLFTIFLTSVMGCARDLPVAESKAASCTACHGLDGISNNDQWPNLAGQKQGYLAAQLKAYRSGERKDAMMSPLAKPLSDAEIDMLAAYFSSL